jgi:hypothetical protein
MRYRRNYLNKSPSKNKEKAQVPGGRELFAAYHKDLPKSAHTLILFGSITVNRKNVLPIETLADSGVLSIILKCDCSIVLTCGCFTWIKFGRLLKYERSLYMYILSMDFYAQQSQCCRGWLLMGYAHTITQ